MIIDYIIAELIGVVIACWIIGYNFKRTPLIPDWSIIYLVALIAIVFSCVCKGLRSRT